MARARINEVIVNNAGTPVTGASVQVNLRASTAATLYAAESGGTTVANPVTTSYGTIAAWVDEGSYDLVVTSGGTTTTYSFEAKKGFGATDDVAAGRVVFGSAGDTNLYRNSSNVLKTDDSLTVAGTLTATTDATVRPQVRASTTGTVTASTSTLKVVQFDTITHASPSSMFTVNDSKFYAPISGLYRISATAGFVANATGTRIIQLRINGTTTIPGSAVFTIPSATLTPSATTSTTYRLAANDYVELIVWQDSGGDLALKIDTTKFTGVDLRPRFEMTYISAY